MAVIGLNENEYERIKSITLLKLLYLEFGKINNSSPIVNITTTGQTALFTVPLGVTGFDLFGFKFRQLGAATTGTLVASVGTNAATYNNILPSTTFTGINSIGDLWIAPLSGKIVRANAGDVITMNVTTAVTGGGAVFEAFMYGEIIS